jgi:hypothetical protein
MKAMLSTVTLPDDAAALAAGEELAAADDRADADDPDDPDGLAAVEALAAEDALATGGFEPDAAGELAEPPHAASSSTEARARPLGSASLADFSGRG